MRSMAVVDIKFHNGELLVLGVSNQEFCSILRRVPYPFMGTSSEVHLEIFHVAHGRYETRAPIRTMQFATLNGEDTLIAAYACSPIVTIPVSQLTDGATVMGKTLGDMGNGQPISMVAYRDEGEDRLFITNVARGPVVLAISNLDGAPAFTAENAPHPNMLLDLSPHMPAGPVGKQVMFVGSSLRADLISDRFFVSLTREADTGSLTLETIRWDRCRSGWKKSGWSSTFRAANMPRRKRADADGDGASHRRRREACRGGATRHRRQAGSPLAAGEYLTILYTFFRTGGGGLRALRVAVGHP